MKREKVEVIYYKYSTNIYSLEQLIKLVKEGEITKDQFHFITTYSYDGLMDINKKKGLT